MKALITGAGGFVGPHLARTLAGAGDDVVGLDLHNGPDLLDGSAWIETVDHHQPEVIYHLAGWSDVSGSWQNPAMTFTINALGTLSVLEAALAAKTHRFVLISSADVYGPVAPADQPITESHPPSPRSPYGVSKQSAEALGLQYQRAHDLGVIVVRPFNHIGPGQSDRFVAPAFATQIADAERHGGGEVAHGDLSAKRDMTDVRDVVRAYRLLAESGEPGEIYNVCSGHAVAMEAMLATLIAQATVPITTMVDPTRLRPVELPILQGSHHKLSEATGWQPDYSLDQTLADVLDDARSRVATAT
ncbi:MAG: NAD-dependent epimerase/dehydratase family protein [Actinomycetia bacterium]|nr:NAD-dependent epimerase/dehydratase family protein [Actinomycetes bacterium]MCP4223549.1 NAD-dependent epimerase/dehydratase family protein [Actinomycetes bacterium]MCP5034063.1 NAD-dependent epimerase/dehydratase family protein [Actinomycetes bacterium]